MTAKKKLKIKQFKAALPYIITGVITLGLVFVGTLDKRSSDTNLSLDIFANSNNNVSVDQMSELYVVADLSDALGLASASDAASNYVATTSMYDSGQTSVGKTEKPNLTDVGSREWVIEYVVGDGETMESIAAKYGITTDQIRWSNGLKTTGVSPGTTLYLPKQSGIVYTVKSGDTVESIASKYGSNVEEITIFNDLEIGELTEGSKLFINGGSLPETERPEYVAPVRRPATTVYTYTYLGSTSERLNIEVVGYFYNLGGPYGRGQCTQWAWYKRQDLPSQLGNANAWARNAAAYGYVVNRTPSAGAVFQTSSGWYGHVGYVEAVNDDGSIVVTEMNYRVPYRVIRSIIPASSVGNFNYIH
ncbi:LysM peptidoglycan-binding domain-containing protein [Candidatus Saccharibacteria bacterium]|nr:LysM peptidoglycan-binding domain-containing protein [Candidatus Saccharibacteria bacterium]